MQKELNYLHHKIELLEKDIAEDEKFAASTENNGQRTYTNSLLVDKYEELEILNALKNLID